MVYIAVLSTLVFVLAASKRALFSRDRKRLQVKMSDVRLKTANAQLWFVACQDHHSACYVVFRQR